MPIKVKTITCHHVYNLGASLQAYALATWLNSTGCEAQIIDYRPDYLSGHYSLTAIANPKYKRFPLSWLYIILKFPKRFSELFSRRKKNFDFFTSQYLPLTEQCYQSFEELCDDCPQADIYIAGSDQIWNTELRNGSDPAFYLAFAPHDAICATYAASFGGNSISPVWKSKIIDWIQALDYVSVREKQGLELLRELGIKTASAVLDPVFLLDAAEWNALCAKCNATASYMLLYDFDNNETLQKAARRLAKLRGLIIISIFPSPYADIQYTEAGPLEFLSLVNHAEYVISNSFHATAFAMIFHRQFAVFSRSENLNQRMKDLVGMVGLSSRMVTNADELVGLSDIRYDDVQPILDHKIIYSREYLYRVLDKAERYD